MEKKALYRNLFFLQLMIGLSLMIAFFAYVHNVKKSSAEKVASMARYSILMNDFREVSKILTWMTKEDFDEVSYKQKGVEKLNLINSENRVSDIWYFSIRQPIFLDMQNKTKIYGEFEFKYKLGKLHFSTYVYFSVILFCGFLVSQYIMRKKASEDLSEIAKQVAHDIRSPLTALEMAARDLSSLPEEQRTIIKGSLQRIHDIANQLLQKGDKDRVVEDVHLLTPLVESLLTEKRMQYRDRLELKLESDISANSYGLFVKANSVELKRLLSNLINNSVEAIAVGSKGIVWVSLKELNGEISLVVQDNGKGIAPDVLERLRNSEVLSEGKAQGNGLGLDHARKTVVGIDGRLDIESAIGEGTRVTLTFPKATSPAWFTPELRITNDLRIIVLDDDSSIHGLWNERLKGASIIHMSTPQEFRDYFSTNSDENILLLSDYELLGFKETGLDLIQEFGLGKMSVLVTSYYEDREIRTRCKELGIRLVPKALASNVPIVREEEQCSEYDAVHIDDDKYLRMGWEMIAHEKGIKLLSVASFSEVRPVLDGLKADCSFYIDQELGTGENGVEIAEELGQLGFGHIYLSTGHDPETFPKNKYIKKVIGKEVPF